MRQALCALLFLGLLGCTIYASPIREETNKDSEEREEEVVVDNRDEKIIIFNWNKGGYDVMGIMEAVLDYERNIAVVMAPHKQQCFVVENLAEVLPKERVVQIVKTKGAGRGRRVQFRRTDLLTDEEKQNLPEENRALCANWPVYKLEPRNNAGEQRLARDLGRENNSQGCANPPANPPPTTTTKKPCYSFWCW